MRIALLHIHYFILTCPKLNDISRTDNEFQADDIIEPETNTQQAEHACSLHSTFSQILVFPRQFSQSLARGHGKFLKLTLMTNSKNPGQQLG